MEDIKIVPLRTFTTRTDAEMARGMLAANGIVSYIHAEEAVGMESFPGGYTPAIKLMIKKSDFSIAEKLMKLHRYA